MVDDLLLKTSHALAELMPAIMRKMMDEFHSREHAGLSPSQLRPLMFIGHHPGLSLSMLAEHTGFSLPMASRLVDGLVKHGFVRRDTDEMDRRRVILSITPSGQNLIDAAHQAERRFMKEHLGSLSVGELQTVCEAFDTLAKAFSTPDRLPGDYESNRGPA